MNSFSTLVTHLFYDFLTIVNNIHMELDNQEKKISSQDIPKRENQQSWSTC